MGEVIGDLLLRDPDEARELVGGAPALAKVAEECVTDSDGALRRGVLATRSGHAARVPYLGPDWPPTRPVVPSGLGPLECSTTMRRPLGPRLPGLVCQPTSFLVRILASAGPCLFKPSEMSLGLDGHRQGGGQAHGKASGDQGARPQASELFGGVSPRRANEKRSRL